MSLDLTKVAAIARRHFYVQIRSLQRWFDTLAWPVVDTVIWGSIGLFVERQGGAPGSSTPYMLSGILLLHVVYQANIAVSVAFMEETWSRNILNLMVTPLRESEYLAGTVAFGLSKLAAGLVMVTLAAGALYGFDVTSAGLGLIPIVAVLMLVGWCVSLVVIGAILRFGSGAEILAWGLLFIVIAVSGTFYPVEALPGVLQPVARALPSTHAFAAARTLLDGEPFPWSRMAAAGLGLAVVVPAALAFAMRMFSVFRARGYVTRYS